MPALALTEISNLFSVIKFYRASENADIKPIIGSEVTVIEDNDTNDPTNLLLLCQNLTGYHNLCALLSHSYTQGQIQGKPYINKKWIVDRNEGLIAINPAYKSKVSRHLVSGNLDEACNEAESWLNIFTDRYYQEVTRCNRLGESGLAENLIYLAGKMSIPAVASNDVRFMHKEDYQAHEVRVCIYEGHTLADTRRISSYSHDQYLRSPGEMYELFSDCPQLVENSVLIAQRCNLELELDKPNMPDYPVPETYAQNDMLVEESWRGLEEQVLARAVERNENVDRNKYEERLKRELDVITSMGFSGYFLIVADFIQWAKSENIPVGPGRGSGAGSLVAYTLGITALDPLDYDLLFERFLNPERVSLPDFDIDFCMERRDEVITYVAERYGRDKVSQIITYGSMAAKAVVRDVGRALGHPYGYVDQIAKLIPFEIGMTLSRALEEDESLKERYNNEEDVAILIDLALKLEGICRNAGKHAGGVVISPKPLTQYMPLYAEQGSTSTVTQFDMGDVEAIGLVKFDFLGLRTLTIIEWAVQNVNKKLRDNNEPEIDITSIPLNDIDTYKLIQSTKTMAVFQLESEGMRKLIKRLQPDSFEDLIALVALFRPGPLQSGMVDDFIDRKHGKSAIHYPHNSLEPILQPTYGVILYQEQVMQIAQVLSGYTLGAADLLRRAMGKKKAEEMAKQREYFVNGATEKGVDQSSAAYIFDLMEKFAGYGFNKSHSAAYALVSYQTAWLKTHYPSAFMAAVLSSDMDNTDKVVSLCEELSRIGIKLRPPCVNTSNYEFSVAEDDSVIYGLGAIKGVGHGAIDAILNVRAVSPFRDIFDFCRRCDLRKVNRRTIEALIKSGAMDILSSSRSYLLSCLDNAIHLAEQTRNNNLLGQNDLFGLDNSETQESSDYININYNEWTEYERLKGEKDTLGFYFTGHPITQYEPELSQFLTARLYQLQPGDHAVTVAGYISNIRTRTGRRGRMAEITLDDKTARVPVIVHADTYQKYRSLLVKDQLILIRGRVDSDDFYELGYTVTVNEMFDLNSVRNNYGTLLLIFDAANSNITNLAAYLRNILQYNWSDACRVAIDYVNQEAVSRIWLGDSWKVYIDDNLLTSLRSSLGDENVKIIYRSLN